MSIFVLRSKFASHLIIINYSLYQATNRQAIKNISYSWHIQKQHVITIEQHPKNINSEAQLKTNQNGWIIDLQNIRKWINKLLNVENQTVCSIDNNVAISKNR